MVKSTSQLAFNASAGLSDEASKLVDAQMALLEAEELAMSSNGEEETFEPLPDDVSSSFARAAFQSKPKSKTD